MIKKYLAKSPRVKVAWGILVLAALGLLGVMAVDFVLSSHQQKMETLFVVGIVSGVALVCWAFFTVIEHG